MFNHNLLSPFSSLGAEDVICLQKLLKYVPGFIFVCMYLKDLGWSHKHDVVPCREVLVMEPNQLPYRSKERGDVCYIAINLNGLDHPKFQVNKRSIRNQA